jgi:hypothetical protein
MTHFDINVAIKTIGNIMKEYGVTKEELLAKFPERPTTQEEVHAIATWIGRDKVRKAGTAVLPAPSPQAMLAEAQRNWARKDKNGKNMPQFFAVEMDGKPHFFRVKPGYKPGIWFVEEQASDEFYPVRQGERRGRILGLIFKDEKAARAMYGKLISRCSRCNRTLTDHDNPYFPMYGPECGGK